MVLYTASRSIPYAEATDPVASYPAIDLSQAGRIDALLQALNIKAAAFGTATIASFTGSNGSVGITFPAGRFSTTPRLFVSLGTAPSGKLVPRGAVSSTTAGTVFVYTGDGSSVTTTAIVYWMAVEAG